MSIKAVVFDYGQVISMPQDESVIDELSALAGVKREDFEPVFWSLRGEYDRGSVSAKEYYNNVLSRFSANVNSKAAEEMMALDLKIWDKVNDETVKLMEDIKQAGLILGILSNMPWDYLGWARKNVPAVALADIGVFSCEVNLIKPEEAIYRKLISLLGVENAEIVFFDDAAHNTNGAKAVGIEAFLWKDAKTARHDLAALGLRTLS